MSDAQTPERPATPALPDTAASSPAASHAAPPTRAMPPKDKDDGELPPTLRGAALSVLWFDPLECRPEP